LILPKEASQNPDLALTLAVEEVERMGIRPRADTFAALENPRSLVAVKVSLGRSVGTFAGAMDSVNDSPLSSLSSMNMDGPPRRSTAAYLTIL